MSTIKAKRIGMNLTQEKLGDLIGVSNTTVSMWETGEAVPRAKTLIKLAEILGCKIDDLLRKEDTSGT